MYRFYLSRCIDRILQHHPHSAVVLCGDFNKLKDSNLKSAHNLKQLVKQPTRDRSILDKIYTNRPQHYSTPVIHPSIGVSDHLVTTVHPAVPVDYTPAVIERVRARKVTASAKLELGAALSVIPWEYLYQLPSCQQQYALFEATVISLIDEYCPVQQVKRCSSDRPWVTDEFRSLVVKRQRAFMAGKMTLYRFYRNRVNLARKRLQRSHYRRSVEQLGDDNPSQWWRDIKQLVGMSKSSNKLQGLANTVCEGNLQELTTRINSFFESVTADFQPITPGAVFHSGPDCSVPDRFTITVGDVEKQLLRLNTNKASGPDGIPAWFLKEYAELLSGPVCCIFNSSVRDGYIPAVWRSADVCPLPKVTAPSLIEKHLRPISLTPVLAKCLERHVTGWILNSMDGFIDPHQFGSLPGSSTVHALVQLVHLWHKALDTPGNMVRVVMLDFAKAFDRVDHTTVLNKFAQLGLPNFLVRWLTGFLCERRQRVRLGQHLSDWSQVKAGVPQGTVLGPISFLLHINDLQTEANHVKYVDDSSLWEVCGADGSDSMIQVATNQAVKWSARNFMKINAEKTKEMVISFSTKPVAPPPVTINNTAIERTESFKLLGVVLSNRLDWSDHCEYLHSKCSQRLYLLVLLRRAGVPDHDILRIYTSMIRSVLEYAAPVWHTSLSQEQSERLESVQKRAFRIVYPDLSYRRALSLTGMQTLHQRREHIARGFFVQMLQPNHKLHHLLPEPRDIMYNLRTVPKYSRIGKSKRFCSTLVPYGLAHWQQP